MKYKVTWKVNGSRPASCPDYKPDPDTGQYPSTHCDVYHQESYTEDRERSFNSRKEAEAFVNLAPTALDGGVFQTKCHSFLIEELTK